MDSPQAAGCHLVSLAYQIISLPSRQSRRNAFDALAGAGASSCPLELLDQSGHRHYIHPARRLDQRRSSLLPATNSTHPFSKRQQTNTTIDFQPKPAIPPFCITTTHRPIHLIKHIQDVGYVKVSLGPSSNWAARSTNPLTGAPPSYHHAMM